MKRARAEVREELREQQHRLTLLTWKHNSVVRGNRNPLLSTACRHTHKVYIETYQSPDRQTDRQTGTKT